MESPSLATPYRQLDDGSSFGIGLVPFESKRDGSINSRDVVVLNAPGPGVRTQTHPQVFSRRPLRQPNQALEVEDYRSLWCLLAIFSAVSIVFMYRSDYPERIKLPYATAVMMLHFSPMAKGEKLCEKVSRVFFGVLASTAISFGWMCFHEARGEHSDIGFFHDWGNFFEFTLAIATTLAAPIILRCSCSRTQNRRTIQADETQEEDLEV